MPNVRGAGRFCGMWWLRELRYSRGGKILMLAVGLSIVGGLGYVGYGAFGTTLNDRINSQAPIETAGGTGEVAIPLTIRQAQCRGAIEQLDRLIKKSLKFSNLDQAQSDLAFLSYAKAARTCTYNEFIEFERSTVMPWAAGADLFQAAKDSGDLQQPAEGVGGSK